MQFCCIIVNFLPGMATSPESAPKRRTAATSALNLAIWPRSVRSLTFATFATRKGTWQRTALMGTRRPATSVGARVILHWSAQVRRQFRELRGKNCCGNKSNIGLKIGYTYILYAWGNIILDNPHQITHCEKGWCWPYWWGCWGPGNLMKSITFVEEI